MPIWVICRAPSHRPHRLPRRRRSLPPGCPGTGPCDAPRPGSLMPGAGAQHSHDGNHGLPADIPLPGAVRPPAALWTLPAGGAIGLFRTQQDRHQPQMAASLRRARRYVFPPSNGHERLPRGCRCAVRVQAIRPQPVEDTRHPSQEGQGVGVAVVGGLPGEETRAKRSPRAAWRLAGQAAPNAGGEVIVDIDGVLVSRTRKRNTWPRPGGRPRSSLAVRVRRPRPGRVRRARRCSAAAGVLWVADGCRAATPGWTFVVGRRDQWPARSGLRGA